MDKMMQEEQLIRWYEAIKNFKKKEADDFKKFFESFPHLFSDPKVKRLYQLFTARYFLMYYQYDQAAANLSDAAPEEWEGDYQLNYYYYFFQGILFYHLNDYRKAMRHLTKAEPIVKIVGSDKELAEFDCILAAVYQRTYHFILSNDYAEQALDIFLNNHHYLRSAHCECLIALNYMNMKQYKEAETFLRRALRHSAKVKDEQVKMMVLHNFGIFYARINRPKIALNYLTQALELIHSDWDYAKVQNLFLSAECFYNAGHPEKAKRMLMRAEALAHQTNLEGYSHRCKMAKAKFYNQDDLKEVYEDGIAYLKTNERWDLVSKYSEELASFYKKEQQYEKACHFYTMALEALNIMNQAQMLSL
ncbi:MAG TPA: tetratricopeptide repeat protein [Bacillales bacterium]|nr:tetratricopeptide repeat protein [Bacillales bacterium]